MFCDVPALVNNILFLFLRYFKIYLSKFLAIFRKKVSFWRSLETAQDDAKDVESRGDDRQHGVRQTEIAVCDGKGTFRALA